MELERLPPYNEAVVGHLLDFIERACIRSHIRSITILTALSMLVDLLHVPSSAIANRRQVLTTEHASTWKRIESAALYRLSSILEDSHGYGYDENDDDDDAGNAIPELLVSAENLVHQFTGEVLPSNDSSSSATPRYPLKDLPCPQRVMNVRRMFANGLLPGGARFRVEHLLFPGSSGTTISSWSDERRLLMAPLLTKWADCVWHAMVLLRSVQWARDELE